MAADEKRCSKGARCAEFLILGKKTRKKGAIPLYPAWYVVLSV